MKELLPTAFAVIKGASLWVFLAGGVWLQQKLREHLSVHAAAARATRLSANAAASRATR